MGDESSIRRELRNVSRGQPLWPGDTLSHATAKECEARGWTRRNAEGGWVLTDAGAAEALRFVDNQPE